MLNITQRYNGILPQDLPSAMQSLFADSPTLTRLFIARGIKQPQELNMELSSLLAADGLYDIDKAVNLIDNAIDSQQRILIVGDFDCDGATSTALMVRVLRQMDAKVDFVVPDRFKYGYGLTPEIVQLGIDTFQPELIVTVDNGISSHDGVDKARENGIDVIITDHHLTTKPTPNANAVVNPNQLNCTFKSKALVGVGVAFYLLGRLAKYRREHNKPSANVSQHLDLVALGTIADVGLLDQNNRILVHHGLNAIKEGRCSLGIRAILEHAGRDAQKMSIQDFGFVIGPRINAAGRMEDMSVGINCLLADDWQTAQRYAAQLEKLNKDRRRVEGEMRQQADEILKELQLTPSSSSPNKSITSTSNKTDNSDKRGIVLFKDDWHQGVIGIVAGRLKETHYQPSIVFAPADCQKLEDTDAIKGSARSIPGIHIRDVIELIAESKPHLITHFGGHAMAAGLTIKKQHFTEFSEVFHQVLSKYDENVFNEEKFTDGRVLAQDFSLQFVDSLQRSFIWGHGFVPPVFDGVFEVNYFKILKDKHLKLSLKYPGVQYPVDAIWFNYNADDWSHQAHQVHVLFEMDINEWNGKQNLQLMVKDLEIISEIQ